VLSINLKDYGLSERFEQEATLYGDLYLARATEQHRDLYKVVCAGGEISASVSGKFAHEAGDQTDFPAVGDWVMIDRSSEDSGSAVIHHVLRRKSMLARQSAGTVVSGQIIAANMDVVFICMSLNEDFNLRRMERYLTLVWDSMATPIIVLTKSDLCDDLQQKLDETATVSIGVEIIVCSSENGSGLDEISAHIEYGKTIAFIGSSGVGKSTLINCLAGQDVMKTKATRQDDKGRHATTHRQLILLPRGDISKGGIVIDTPGMRELQMRGGNLSKTFEDIEDISQRCKFRDCSHDTEVGCAIREAIKNGVLSEERFESYQKLQREIKYSGLSSRQIENEKFIGWFGSKNEIKQFKRNLKKR